MQASHLNNERWKKLEDRELLTLLGLKDQIVYVIITSVKGSRQEEES